MSDVALLQAAGAPQTKPTKFVPLTVRRIFTGLFSNRNPMLEPARAPSHASTADARMHCGMARTSRSQTPVP